MCELAGLYYSRKQKNLEKRWEKKDSWGQMRGFTSGGKG